jgi:predicted transcriptional regulator
MNNDVLLPGGTMNRILWWLIAGSKGGANRANILMALKERPCNAHQLSERLSLDYKTIQHHLRILDQNRLIVSQGGGYGKVYFLSKEFEASFQEFLEIWDRVGKK